MRDNAPLPPAALHPPGLPLQPLQGVKGAPGLEGADALQVLAFEPEPDLRVGGFPLFPFLLLLIPFFCRGRGRGRCRGGVLPDGPRQLGRVPAPRREGRQRRVAEDGRAVHEGPDQGCGLGDGGAGERG